MAPELLATSDPSVFIEEKRPGYVRYVNADGRRWEVHGECVKLGHCMVGAVVDGVEIPDLETARRVIEEHPFALDSPVTPEFSGCCPFTFVELEAAG